MRAARMTLAGLLAALAAAIALPASGDPNSPELAARFASGEYLEAARMAESAAGADDLAFAARALLAHCMTGAGEPEAGVVERAAGDAEAALRLDPRHEEGRLQLAIALSLKSRSMDAMDAWSAGYGDRGRRLAREVLEMDPANFYAHGFLAVWNVEVRRRGGSVGAGIMGASLAEARRHYRLAVELAPADIGVRWQYARALVALDGVKHGDEAAGALAAAVAATPRDHVEEVMRGRAVELSAVLLADRRSAQRLALRML